VKRGSTDAETCRLNGWDVGTVLVGDEGYGPTTIQITAIGEECILARTGSWCESTWTLTCREWERGEPAL